MQTWQYEQAITLLRDGCCDMALPFANRVMWVPSEHVADLRREVSDERLDALTYEVSDDAYIFLGLIHLSNTRSFKHVRHDGNERFRSWGYEEMEFYVRLLKLGFRVRRTYGQALWVFFCATRMAVSAAMRTVWTFSTISANITGYSRSMHRSSGTT